MTFFRQSTDSFTDAYESIWKEVRKLQKRVEKQTRSPLRQLRKNVLANHARGLRNDAKEQLVSGVEVVLGYMQIASTNDLQRIDRRLKQVDRKLRAAENARKTKKSDGAAPAS